MASLGIMPCLFSYVLKEASILFTFLLWLEGVVHTRFMLLQQIVEFIGIFGGACDILVLDSYLQVCDEVKS